MRSDRRPGCRRLRVHSPLPCDWGDVPDAQLVRHAKMDNTQDMKQAAVLKHHDQQTEEVLQAALARTDVLHRLSHAVIHVEDLNEELQAVVDSVADALPTDLVLLYNFDLEQRHIVHAFKGGGGRERVAFVAFEELMEGLSGWVLRENKPVLSPKGDLDPRESPAVQHRRRENDCGAIIVVPLRYRNQTIGTLTAINRSDQRDFTAEDVKVMTTMANQATVAIEKARLVESLRASEERFRSAFDDAAIGMALLAPDGRWLKVNRSLCELAGYSEEELLALDFQSITHPDDLDANLDALRQMLNGEIRTYEMEKRFLHKEGRLVWVQLNASLVRDAENRPLYLTSQILDITKRKQAEQALSEYAQAVVRSNKELEQFAYIVSHDLQEPLRTISSFVTLLKKRCQGQLDEDADSFIGFILDGSERMQALIQALLELSRVGRKELERWPVDTEAVLEQTLADLQTMLQEAQAEVTYDPLPSVEGDAPQLGMLFQNLIGNAVKFRGEDTPRVHVAALRRDDAWRFSVSDNGIGIREQFHERIFEVFRRLHTRTKYGGTGIGLAICKKIVERHGGRIWVESEQGQGATFFFTIPAA